jgi:hypothetical protein
MTEEYLMKMFPYKVKVILNHFQSIGDVVDWLNKNVGRSLSSSYKDEVDDALYEYWQGYNGFCYFKRQKDAALFKMMMMN